MNLDPDILRCALFNHLENDVIAEVLSSSETRKYAAQSVLIQKDTVPSALYIIRRGKIGIYNEDILLAELGVLTIMGESFLAETTATATTIALTELETIEIRRDVFFDLAIKYPRIVLNIFSITANRLRRSNDAAMNEAHSREQKLKQLVEERTAELNETLEELRHTQKFKDQFLANMSHEIRTPMNAVLGMTYLALDTALTPKQNKYLQAIKNSSENLLVIINDILDLSKLQAGKMDLEHIAFRISEPIEQVFDTLRFKAEEKGLVFHYTIGKNVPEIIIGDSARLIQILLNLCSNAIKFTHKGNVHLQIDKQADTDCTLLFTITDTGIGIPENKLDRLFGDFQQVDAGISRRYGGTGLGLSISKQLVELQEGKIEVKSTEGVGSEFSFSIPYKLPDKQQIEKLGPKQKLNYAALRGLKVLVAEDNEFNQIVINDTIETLIPEATIDIADNGKKAIEKLQQNAYDLILMDSQMPEMDGLEATRYIRQNMRDDKKSIPIIALTASVLQTDIQRCMDAGMNAYVPKPFTRENLFRTMMQFYTLENITETQEQDSEVPMQMEMEKDEITDLTFLREFCEGNQKVMSKYIQMYITASSKNLEKINSAFSAEDYPAVKIFAHAMRPHLNFMGMAKANAAATKVEQIIDTNQAPDEIAGLIEIINANCAQAEIELTERLKQLQIK